MRRKDGDDRGQHGPSSRLPRWSNGRIGCVRSVCSLAIAFFALWLRLAGRFLHPPCLYPLPEPPEYHRYSYQHSTGEEHSNLHKGPRSRKEVEKEGGMETFEEVVRRTESRLDYPGQV